MKTLPAIFLVKLEGLYCGGACDTACCDVRDLKAARKLDAEQLAER